MFGSTRTSVNKNMIIIVLCFFASSYQLCGQNEKLDRSHFFKAIKHHNLDEIKLLVDQDLQYLDTVDGQNPLSYAIARAANPKIIEFLLSKGADVHALKAVPSLLVRDFSDSGVITISAKSVLGENIVFLLDEPLYAPNRIQIHKLLLHYGADPNEKINFSIVDATHNITLAPALLEFIAFVPELSIAVKKDLIDSLLTYGADRLAPAIINLRASPAQTVQDRYSIIKQVHNEQVKRSIQKFDTLYNTKKLPREIVDHIFNFEKQLPEQIPVQD